MASPAIRPSVAALEHLPGWYCCVPGGGKKEVLLSFIFIFI